MTSDPSATPPPVDPLAFRRDLDAVLERRDPAALRAFLIERGEWEPETTMDPEAALWMMTAASPTLGHRHAEALAWLRGHGRGDAADAIAGRQAPPPQPRRPKPRS